MPDISMCAGDNCPLKDSCYRYRAIPLERQQWNKFIYNSDTNHCDYFRDVKNIDESKLSPPSIDRYK